jgi:hypothetical protein
MVIEHDARQSAPAEIAPAPRIRTRRNPKWIALGVVAICLGAIASFFLYSQVAESHQVVVVRHTVSRGATIRSGDLGVVTVGSTAGVRTVPAAAIDGLIGQIAAVDLIEGSLLVPGAVTREVPPAHGNDIVGIRVPTGRAPGGFLPPGSPVRLVVLPADAGRTDVTGGGSVDDAGTGESPRTPSDDELTNVATISAVVVDSTALEDGLLINVELDSGQAVDAASYAAQDRVVVIRESER